MTILFSDLCLLFDRIAHSTTVNSRRNPKGKQKECPPPQEILESWISALEAPIHLDGLLIYRLLFPEHDIRRRYGLKETLLIRELPAALNFVPPAYLVDWNGSTASSSDATFLHEQKHGCFGLCIREALEHRVANTSHTSLTIAQVDSLLDELACHSEFSSQDVRHKHRQLRGDVRPRGVILHDLFSPLSSSEAGYLSQIILRDLSPMLYPLPSSNTEVSLLSYNSTSWTPLEFMSALRAWHWSLPAIYRYRADLDAAFTVLSTCQISASKSFGAINSVLEDLKS